MRSRSFLLEAVASLEDGLVSHGAIERLAIALLAASLPIWGLVVLRGGSDRRGPAGAGQAALVHGFVDVRSAVVEDGTDLIVDRTKSEAGVRVVGLRAVIVPELRGHLARWSESGAEGRVFVGPKGDAARVFSDVTAVAAGFRALGSRS
jgi:hypothetical protein